MDDKGYRTATLLNDFVAVQQRNLLIRQQGEQASEQRTALAALERQIQIDKDRARTEQDLLNVQQQLLRIERERQAAEKAEREMQRQHTEQVKTLRNLIAEATTSLARFRNRHLA